MDERSDSARSECTSSHSENVNDVTMLGWNEEHIHYRCRDDAVLEVPKRTAIRYDKDEDSTIPCEKLFVGNVTFNRNMREIIESEDVIRTIVFPKTIRVVR